MPESMIQVHVVEVLLLMQISAWLIYVYRRVMCFGHSLVVDAAMSRNEHGPAQECLVGTTL